MRLFSSFFFFNTVCSLLVPDLINLFPNHVGPDQTLHTMASDLGHIVCKSHPEVAWVSHYVYSGHLSDPSIFLSRRAGRIRQVGVYIKIH